MISENNLLKMFLWPQDKKQILGNLVFTNIQNLETEYIVSIDRGDISIEIIYSSNPIGNQDNTKCFIHLILENLGDNWSPNFELSSEEIKNNKDVEDVLKNISSIIMKMNVPPILYATGLSSQT